MKELLCTTLLVLLLGSCSEPYHSSAKEQLHITSPEEGSRFSPEEVIFFDSRTEGTDSLEWTSSLDGYLGDSPRFARRLTPGTHLITLGTPSGKGDEVEITISQPLYEPGKSIVRQLSARENRIILSAGKYSPLVYSLGTSSFSTSMERDITTESSGVISDFPSPGDSFLPLKMGVERTAKMSAPKMTGETKTRGTPAGSVYTVGDSRNFTVADTNGTGNTGEIVPAELYFQSEKVHIWLDCGSQRDEDRLQQLCDTIDTLCLKRVISLWGEWEDINGNGAIEVLITPKINREEKAVGFFNTCDFYAYCGDSGSPDYNPVTNHMDIVYLGDPSENPEQFAYAVPSLAATFCHELFHLIHYSRKVYLPYTNGVPDPEPEELFLDEGLAHLTETLCGFGESGGNLAFFSLYLAEPWKYSLKGADLYGSLDSVGKRGAMSAFLCRLFWNAGGFEGGGKAFLRRLQSSDCVGWENIGYALGSSADRALEEWFRYLNEASPETREIILDPVTGEALNMDPFRGNYRVNEKDYPLTGPTRISPGDSYTLIPYGALWFESIEPTKKTGYLVRGEPDSGYASAVFHMPEG